MPERKKLEWFEIDGDAGHRWACSVDHETDDELGQPIELTSTGVVTVNPVGGGFLARIEWAGKSTEQAMTGGRSRQTPRIFEKFDNAKKWVARRLRPYL
jgi:hypothetical protein